MSFPDELQNAENTLREVEKGNPFENDSYFRLAFEISCDGILEWILNENIIIFSDPLKEILGLKPSKTKNSFDDWCQLIHPDDLNFIYDDLVALQKGKISMFRNKHRLLSKDNAYRWMLCRGKTISTDPEGNPERIICTFTDLSAPEKTSHTLIEVSGNREELSDLNEKTFLSMISHEFRSPLSTIMITADAVEAYLERMSSAEVRGKMALIRNNTLFLDVLMQKILNLALLNSGNLDYLPAETDFNEFVSIIIAEIKEREDLNHVIDFRETQQPVFISIDIEMMKLSLKNLIFNALKYSPEGSTVTIDLSVINSDLAVQITDHGIGIPEEDAACIYDVFYRGSNVRHIRGTGLGLCLVRKCVACHGGRLSFVSRENIGTTFTMTLPGVKREAGSFFKGN